MDGTGWVVVVGATASAMGAIAAAIRAGSGAYQEAIDRRARELDATRLAVQAEATVTAKNTEIEELKIENARLWKLVGEKAG